MKTVFEGTIHTHYGQAYIHLQDTCDWADGVRDNQINGLLGAAVPTTLFLTIGLHTGQVWLSVKVSDSRPDLDESWEEAVEASFTMPETAALGLTDWGGSIWEPIPLEPGTYRVRYTATAFGKGEEVSPDDCSSDPVEKYEVVFWPAPLQKDEILKVTSPAAQYWHDVAQGRA